MRRATSGVDACFCCAGCLAIAQTIRAAGLSAFYLRRDRVAAPLQAVDEASYDLVLMDLHMPVMDGVAATQAIRARPDGSGRRLKIIALTADAFDDTRERCLRAGMDDFLSKPLDLSELKALFARHFPAEEAHAPSAAAAAPQGAAASEDAQQLLDHKVIDGVRSVMPAPRYAALLATFFDGAANTLAGMREAATAQRDEAVRESAHRMKGAALNLGLKALARTAQTLQQHAVGGSTDAAQRLLDELASQLSASRSECARLGLMFIGPRPEVMRLLGDKI